MDTPNIPISHTKVSFPLLGPEILHRTRLLALFDELLDKKLILVNAPAGYGKTTLLVDFARQSRLPVCWLSLDALDRDPQRFCAYLIAALGKNFTKFGKQSRSVLKSLTGLQAETERFLTVFINEIDSIIDEHFVLIVDDFQFVDSVPFIRDLFSRFIYMAGENCHVILASRRLPALPDITLMVARGQVGGFDLEQIAFQSEEIRSLFWLDYGVTLADTDLEMLVQQTEGWVTGLHLSGSRPSDGVPDLTRAARTAGVDLSFYFDQQIFSPLPTGLQDFLLRTSLLEEFNAELCQAVFGAGDWKTLLRAIQQNNLFVQKVGAGGKWLRYHHLFQDFLQQRLREQEPETAREILVQLVEVYKGQMEWEKAYAIVRQMPDQKSTAELIDFAGPSLLLNERLITLRTWLDSLPPDVLQERPTLLSLQGGLFCALGDGESACRTLNQAYAEFKRINLIPGMAQSLVRRAAAHRLLGNYSNSLEDADEAMQLSEKDPQSQVVFAEAERFKGICLNHMGRLAEAARFQEDALRCFETLGDEPRAAWVRMELGITYRATGNYSGARSAYEKSLAEWERENNLTPQVNLLNSLGVLHHCLGEYEQAVKTFEKGLDCNRWGSSLWLESLTLTSLGDVFTDIPEYEAAGQAYGRAARVAQQKNFQYLINYLALAEARLARLQGNLKEAQLHLKRAARLIEYSKSNSEKGFYLTETGCLKLLEQDYGNAVIAFKEALANYQEGGLTAESTCVQVWLAAAYIQANDTALARELLEPVLHKNSSSPSYHTILQIIRQARSWLKDLQDDQEIGPELTIWFERVDQLEASLPALKKRLRRFLTVVPIEEPGLVIKAFGKARVQASGKWITTSQWKTASVRELFFYLLAAPRPVSKEVIGAALWKELDTDQLKLRFKNNLYRLRHALGQEVILFENDHYHFNSFLDYDYDLENFSDNLARAKTAATLDDRIAYLRKSLSSRNGPYLQDLDASWITPEREHLDRLFLDGLKQLADALRQKGDWSAALKTCQEALKVDNCHEDFYRLAMQLFADKGDRMAVIWQYRTCQKVLKEELGVEPSEDTHKLYQRLIG
jgi:LuxR family transcriptional regulator, maltose regulon positive regulatory protein